MHRRKLALNANYFCSATISFGVIAHDPTGNDAALWIDNDSIRENERAVTKRSTDEIRDQDRLKASQDA